MRAKWRRDPRRPSHNIGGGDGSPRLLEPRASLPDASQLPSITKPSKANRSVSVADGGASAKDKCASPGDGKKTLWRRLFRFRNSKQYGSHQNSGQRTASVSEEIEMRKEEASGLSCSSQVNVFQRAITNRRDHPRQWRHRSNLYDVTIAEKLPTEEEASFIFQKSLNANASLSFEPSMSPTQVVLACQLFGEHSANDKTAITQFENVDFVVQRTDPGHLSILGKQEICFWRTRAARKVSNLQI